MWCRARESRSGKRGLEEDTASGRAGRRSGDTAGPMNRCLAGLAGGLIGTGVRSAVGARAVVTLMAGLALMGGMSPNIACASFERKCRKLGVRRWTQGRSECADVGNKNITIMGRSRGVVAREVLAEGATDELQLVLS